MSKAHTASSRMKGPEITNMKQLKRKNNDVIYEQNNERKQICYTATNPNY